MRVYFIRHGQSEANLHNIISNRTLNKHGLTELGRQQAEEAANRLKQTVSHLQAIYASPLLRARQTASIIARQFGLSADHVLVTPAVIERNPGILEGLSKPEDWEQYMGMALAWREGNLDAREEGGESFNNIRARFEPFIHHLRSEHKDRPGDVIVIGHAGTFMMMLPLLMSNIDHSVLNGEELPNGGIVESEWQGNELVCVSWAGRPMP